MLSNRLRAAILRYRPSFIVRITGALTLCMTFALVLIIGMHGFYPVNNCIQLVLRIQHSQTHDDGWLTDNSLYDVSSGRYFNHHPPYTGDLYRDTFQRSPDDAYIASTKYAPATDTLHLVVAETGIEASVVLRQPIQDDTTPAQRRLFLWSPDSHWIGYQVQTDSTHIQYKLAEVVPPYRIETVPQSLSVTGRLLGWSADDQYVAINDWDGSTRIVTILATADLHTVMTSSQPQPAIRNDPYINVWDAAWSPQGHTLAYQSFDGSLTHLVFLSPDRQTERIEVPSSPIIDVYQNMFWSPKGTYLAVLSVTDPTMDNTSQLDIFDMDGSALRDIAKDVQNAGCGGGCQAIELHWSADEGALSYVNAASRNERGRADLITLWLKDSRHETIATNLYTDPVPLLDTRWLWVEPTSPPDLWGVTDAVLYSTDLHKKIVLTTYSEASQISNSPDGKIALAWNVSTETATATSAKLEWQPGGKGLVWTRLADGILHTVEDTAQSITFLNWSANSQWFTHLVAPEGAQGTSYMGIANVATGEFHRITSNFPKINYQSAQALPNYFSY